MHNRDKYPEIWAAKEAAELELKPLMEKRAAFTDQIAAVELQINVLESEKEQLNDSAMQDAERIHELKDTVARMAKAMGAKTAG